MNDEYTYTNDKHSNNEQVDKWCTSIMITHKNNKH